VHNKHKKHKKQKTKTQKMLHVSVVREFLIPVIKLNIYLKSRKWKSILIFLSYFVLYVLRSFTLSVLYYIPRPIIIGNILMCTHVATLPQD